MNFTDKLVSLAETFPTLRGAKGLRPFDPPTLLQNAHGGGKAHAARFVLNLYNSNSYAFNLGAALGTWDESHRAAFSAWARDPFWC